MINTIIPDTEPPFENCCFCRKPTSSWTALENRTPREQVACCPHCASRGFPEDVPSKHVWIRRECICHKPTVGEEANGRGKLDRPNEYQIAIYPSKR